MTGLQPAVPELVAFAAKTRSDWDADDLDGAILAALQAGWEWEAIYREVHRLMLIGDGTPASLRAACRRPEPDGPAKDTWKRGAALARHMFEHRNDVIDETGEPAA